MNVARRFYARTDPRYPGLLPDVPGVQWQPLENHLMTVAELAAGFCKAFDAEEWGRLAGIWHDLGKYQVAFQRKLCGEQNSCEHSGAGAALAVEKDRHVGLPLAFVIAGHHAGLSNPIASQAGDADSVTPLQERLVANRKSLESIREDTPAEILEYRLPMMPPRLLPSKDIGESKNEINRSAEFWIRLLFSALVDADRLNSEAWPCGATKRGGFDSITKLRARLDETINRKMAALTVDESIGLVNVARARILDACRETANEPPGLFSLAVPTGGGKTLSAMSFALRHAERHDLGRVIVVIPYTSIIEQNAGVYREALGSGNVIEHHSNLDPERQRQTLGEEVASREELAAENWDAPVIVTTTVQFFESLFTSHASRARKLHNIARSVVILDEVQTLPPGFLLPILDALRELTANYGCTVVLSTATPPALKKRTALPKGLEGIRPIIAEADYDTLVRKLSRVKFAWPQRDAPPKSWEDLASELAECPRVLAIVHKRADARELARQLKALRPDESLFHLSALMCPAHRGETLKAIKAALNEGSPCRVVATQLVEAGVDLDFPVVYRALGGLDSMVQAAGRCNREGKLLAPGKVVVFRAPTKPPKGVLQRALVQTESLLNECAGAFNIDDPKIIERFFRKLYHVSNLDEKRIQTNRAGFNFATVGREFQLIEDGFTETLVIAWGEEGSRRIERLHSGGPSREAYRALQPYSVKIYNSTFGKWFEDGVIEKVVATGIPSGLYTLTPVYAHLYDAILGLIDGDEPVANPVALMT